jgi:hypothetical protein
MLQHIAHPSIQQTIYHVVGGVNFCYFCVDVSLLLECDAVSLVIGSWQFEMTQWPHLRGLKYLTRIVFRCFDP